MTTPDGAVAVVLLLEIDPTAASDTLALAEDLAGAGVRVLPVPPLYHAAEDDPLWDRLAALEASLVWVTGLPPRPAEWLLRSHGLGRHGLQVFAFPEGDDLTALRQELTALPGVVSTPPGRPESLPETAVLTRWYPVLDKSRCVDCGHCHQFCLFGVYEQDQAGEITVARPDQCKAGCPACARICPHGAIIFPLYRQDPAIAGAPGQYVTLDAEGRQLFYHRTGTACPACGQSGPSRPGEGDRCAECGRPRVEAARPASARDELDALLDELEDMARGGN